MSLDGWNRVLVLGGIRSGKSQYAESLVADAATVRYVATAAGDDGAEWAARLAAHRDRRPASWSTEETASDPRRLADVIATARADETLLVDDLGGWVTVLLDPAHQPADDTTTIEELVAAIRECAARLVLVSPEVGLSLVPTTPLGRAFTDALGLVNRAVAEVCDTVLLVVAGQPCQLKPPATVPAADPAGAGVPAQTGPVGDVSVPASPAVTTPQARPAAPAVAIIPGGSLPVAADGPEIGPGMELPMPDLDAGPQALERLAGLDLPGRGFGVLEQVVAFAATTQGTSTPQPWESVRVLLVHGDHEGGSAAGTRSGDSARRAEQARSGQGVLARLAAESGAALQVIEAPTAAPIEDGPALTAEQVESALRYGWRLAEEAVDAGVQLLVLAACGAGTEAAAAAVLAATAGAEPSAVLARVINRGEYDDAAWMARCAAIRDAIQRCRGMAREAKDVLAQVGGGDIAVATGILLGATARRTPVLLDGPVGMAAGLVSRDLAGQARHWCLLADHGGQPGIRLAADVLGLTPLAELKLDLGEGANALTVLPMLRSALTLAAALPARPDPAAEVPTESVEPDSPEPDSQELDFPEPDSQEPDFREPEPEGPGPTSTSAASADHSGSRAG
ncbi:bifunctional adenosylcobinamide kinase/adenosylcobinamide-phosphate guanylyltransferase [Micromonospora sp. NPDC047134]|uniref:bifunctional adenosylcobinamide kinase/adenosylcobinamide-phosphate guanylyltransferase n=1 Tax=Micromonospora sp. NPDC047134 TaxID=3154340 RepID=UPI0033C9111F